jgi:hypothetical protein
MRYLTSQAATAPIVRCSGERRKLWEADRQAIAHGALSVANAAASREGLQRRRWGSIAAVAAATASKVGWA